MQPFLSAKGVDWIYQYGPARDALDALNDSLTLHELIQEDILEPMTHDKIDVYEEDIFIVVHFPKYNPVRQQYLLNEFDIILRKDQLITLTRFKSNHMDVIKKHCEGLMQEAESDEQYKFSSYYILYRIFDTMYDKVFRGLKMFAKDLLAIEEEIFGGSVSDLSLLEQIMIKRRNIVQLKHLMHPHGEIIEELQEATLKQFGGELDVYFEDLSYKIDKIMNTITIHNEDIDSLYDVYSTLVSMKTSRAVTVLTIFTAVIGVMTLITGFYGMNIPLPYQGKTWTFIAVMLLLVGVSVVMLGFFRSKKWW